MIRYGNLRRAGIGSALLASLAMALPATAEISITPRFGYYFDNSAQRAPPGGLQASPLITTYVNQTNAAVVQNGGQFAASDVGAIEAQTIAYPQYGGTITLTLGEESAFSLAFTALYGTASVKDTVLVSEQYLNYKFPTGATFVDTITSTTGGSSELKRFDVEAVLQYRMTETFSILAGLRGEHASATHDLAYTQTMSLNALNYLTDLANRNQIQAGQLPTHAPVFVQSGVINFQEKAAPWVFSIRTGVAAYVPVGEKHLLYANGLIQFTRSPGTEYRYIFPASGYYQSLPGQDTETTIGPDISVGYMYRFSDRFGIDWRYRASAYFPIAGQRDFKDSRVRHGTMIGFTTWFGDR